MLVFKLFKLLMPVLEGANPFARLRLDKYLKWVFGIGIAIGSAHYALVALTYAGPLRRPVEEIYLFLTLIYLINHGITLLINYISKNSIGHSFISLAAFRMGMSIAFLWPVILNDGGHINQEIEVLNFMMAYLIYLFLYVVHVVNLVNALYEQ